MNKIVADIQTLTLDEETKNRIQLLSFLVMLFILSLGVIAWVVYSEQLSEKDGVMGKTNTPDLQIAVAGMDLAK